MNYEAEIINETKESKVYKVEIFDEDLNELFETIHNLERYADSTLSAFAKRIDKLGHEVHGYDNDDDYGAIAATTAQRRGKYGGDEEACHYASEYVKASQRKSDMRTVLFTLGFRGEYRRWEKENGYL